MMTLIDACKKGKMSFATPEMECLSLHLQDVLTASTDPEPENPVKEPLNKELPERDA